MPMSHDGICSSAELFGRLEATLAAALVSHTYSKICLLKPLNIQTTARNAVYCCCVSFFVLTLLAAALVSHTYIPMSVKIPECNGNATPLFNQSHV